MIALLLPHTGAHVAPHAAMLPALPLIFRRAVAAVRRKQAAPETTRPSSGAATPTTLLGEPREHDLLSDAERTALFATRRARQHADAMHAGYARAVDRLRADAGLPTVEEMRAEYFALPKREPMRREPGKPPWHTMAHPVYGQAPVADVLAAGRQAGAMLP